MHSIHKNAHTYIHTGKPRVMSCNNIHIQYVYVVVHAHTQTTQNTCPGQKEKRTEV